MRPYQCYHSGSVDLGVMSMKRHSPKLQHYWSLAIKLFCVISRTWGGDVIPHLSRNVVSVFHCPSRLVCVSLEFFVCNYYIKYSDLIQIICPQLYSFKYCYCHAISHWEEGDKITTPRI